MEKDFAVDCSKVSPGVAFFRVDGEGASKGISCFVKELQV